MRFLALPLTFECMKRCQHECKYNEQKIKFSINLKKTTKGNVLYTLLCGVNSNENKKNFNTNTFNRMALDTIQTRRRWIYLVIFRCNNLLMTHNYLIGLTNGIAI